MRIGLAFFSVTSLGVAACSTTPGQTELASASPETTTGAGPFVVNTYPIDPNRLEVGRELRELDENIDNAQDAGNLSRREARRARKQVVVLASEANRSSHDGLSDMLATSIATSARGVESLVNAPAVPN